MDRSTVVVAGLYHEPISLPLVVGAASVGGVNQLSGRMPTGRLAGWLAGCQSVSQSRLVSSIVVGPLGRFALKRVRGLRKSVEPGQDWAARFMRSAATIGDHYRPPYRMHLRLSRPEKRFGHLSGSRDKSARTALDAVKTAPINIPDGRAELLLYLN